MQPLEIILVRRLEHPLSIDYEGPMSFGRNPHVAKAQAAEQKADLAADHLARERAYREAAHLWERAASREQPGKRRVEYEGHAERLRGLADGGLADEPTLDGGLAEARPAAESGARFMN